MPIKFTDLFNSMDESFNNQKLEEFFNKTRDAAEIVSKKSAERIEISRKVVECLDAKAKLAKQFEKYGKLQYSAYIGEEVDEAELVACADNIAELKEKIKIYTVDIEDAKASFSESMANAAKKTKDAFSQEKEPDFDTEVEVVVSEENENE